MDAMLGVFGKDT